MSHINPSSGLAIAGLAESDPVRTCLDLKLIFRKKNISIYK